MLLETDLLGDIPERMSADANCLRKARSSHFQAAIACLKGAEIATSER